MRSIQNIMPLALGFAAMSAFDFSRLDSDTAMSGKVDTIVGSNHNDLIDESESKHSVIIFGNGGNDYLMGSTHNDTLHGGNGADVLVAGGGKDVMYGDGGIDVFAFSDTGSTTIMDMHNADYLNTTLIDADTTTDGMQSFVKVDHFTHHAGELMLKYNAGHDQTMILMDTDGDGKADLREFMEGNHMDVSHFTL